MASVILDLLTSIFFIFSSLLFDVLNVATRCLIPIGWGLGFRFAAFVALTESGLFLGLLGTISVGVIAVAVATLRFDMSTQRACAHLFGVLYGLDALLQVLAFVGILSYPKSHTGWMAVMLQLPGFALAFEKSFPREWTSFVGRHFLRYFLFAFGIGLMFCGWSLAEKENIVGSYGASIISKGCFIATFCSAGMLKVAADILQQLQKWSVVAFSWVYVLVTRVWPHVRAFLFRVWMLIYHPAVVWFQRTFVAPFWRVITPLVTPCATAYIVLFSISSIRESLATGFNVSGHEIIFLLAHVFCAASALLSTFILFAHGFARIFAVQLDPLKFRFVKVSLQISALGLSFIHIVVQTIIQRLARGTILRILGEIFSQLGRFSRQYPMAALAMVFLGNVVVLYVAYASDLGAFVSSTFFSCLRAIQALFLGMVSEVVSIQSQPLLRSGDSTLALVMIALSQILVYSLVRSTICAVQLPLAPDRAEELNALAGGMSDPRQCGRCWFGPIDHTGCDFLTSHHGERRRGGSRVSNACPQCGWFVAGLDEWPYWDGAGRTAAGLVVVRMRVWGEVVMAVRAAAKALIIPFVLLRLTMLPASLSAFLALSYLVPWLVENTSVYGQTYTSRAQRYTRRGAPASAGWQNPVVVDVDCGRAPVREQRQEPSVAMEQILAAYPAKVFLDVDGMCSICLEEFAKEAVTAAQQLKGAEVAARLRALDPSIVALRCGHPLHTECIEQAVRAASAASRHVRCPLCREPVNLAGAVSARCFS